MKAIPGSGSADLAIVERAGESLQLVRRTADGRLPPAAGAAIAADTGSLAGLLRAGRAALRRLSGPRSPAPVAIAPASAGDRNLAAVQLRLDEIDHELLGFRAELNGLADRLKIAPRKEAQRLAERNRNARLQVKQLVAERETARARIASAAAAHPADFLVMGAAIYELRTAIVEGDIARAALWRDRIVETSPLWLERRLRMLRAYAVHAGQLNLLFDLLANGPTAALSRVRLIARTMEIGIELGRDLDVDQLVATAYARSAPDYVRFGPGDQLNLEMTRLDHARRMQLATIKYKDVPLSREEDIFDAAEILADRIDLDPCLVDHLAAMRSDQALPRAEWERRFRVASCVEHIAYDRPRPAPGQPGRRGGYLGLVDMTAANRVFDGLDASRGILVLWFHGGLRHEALRAFQRRFPEGIILGRGGEQAHPRTIVVKDDPAVAMFQAVRAMTDGKTVLMAPDGRHGDRSHSVDLAGRSIRSAIGGAVIAYESGCHCVSYAMLPVGRRFVAVASLGPRPEPGEKLDGFTRRWLAFYWGQIEAILTGDPDRLALGRQWSTLSQWDR